MSIIYCEKHDIRWDSDFKEQCPACECEPEAIDRAQTDHISACRRLWFDHLQTCESCYKACMESLPVRCFEGKCLQDEYICSFYACRDLETVTATEATCPQIPK